MFSGHTDSSDGTDFLSNSDSCVDLLYWLVVYLMVSLREFVTQ